MQQQIYRSNVYAKEDANGCILKVTLFSDGERDVAAQIHLKAANERRLRSLGFVTLRDGVYHVKRDRSKHLHNASQSYGFCHEALTDTMFYEIKFIHLLEDDVTHYVFPLSTILNFGSYLHFREQGFERQRFLRLDTLQHFKQPEYAGEYVTSDSYDAGE